MSILKKIAMEIDTMYIIKVENKTVKYLRTIYMISIKYIFGSPMHLLEQKENN